MVEIMNGFNLSTYTYIDKNIRIYDKYIYTISGTYVYNFIRNTNRYKYLYIRNAFWKF